LLGNAIQRQIDLNDTHKIFEALGIDPHQEKNCYLLALDAIGALKLHTQDGHTKFAVAKSILQIPASLSWGDTINFLQNIQSDRLRAKAHQDILNTRNAELSGELTSLHHSIANALGIEFVSNSANFAAMVRMRNGNTTMRQQILDLQQTLRDLRCGVALKLGVVYEGDAPLIGACAALRDEHKAMTAAFNTISKSNDNQHSHIMEILSVLGVDSSTHWPDRIAELRALKELSEHNSQDLCRFERDMEKVCATLGVNPASHVDYIISTIASIKSASAPPKAQLAYEVRDKGDCWSVTVDNAHPDFFSKGPKYYGSFAAHITKLESVFGYKQRK